MANNPTFTHKHYEELARILRCIRPATNFVVFDRIVDIFREELARDNARFNQERFYRAIYKGE